LRCCHYCHRNAEFLERDQLLGPQRSYLALDDGAVVLQRGQPGQAVVYPAASGFYDGKSKIAFYSKKNCQGTVRTWFTTDEAFPANLALDGIDSGIKSFMLWQINDKARRIVTTNLTYTRSSD